MKRWLSAVLVLLLTAMPFSGCGKKARFPKNSGVGAAIANEQLIAPVQTREEAERIGELYGIELVKLSAHLAYYKTEEDPETVLQRGIDNGWPRLAINYIMEDC